MEAAKVNSSGRAISYQLGIAQQAPQRSAQLVKDIKTRSGWLRQDVLELAGPALATRLELYDFVTAELRAREHLDKKRIGKLESIAQDNGVCMYLVSRPVCCSASQPRHLCTGKVGVACALRWGTNVT
jgi:hypothetical protein